MSRKYKIQELFYYVKTNHEEKAREVLEDAKVELGLARQIACLSSIGKKSLKTIEEIIKAVSEGKMKGNKDFKTKCTKAETGFSGQVIGHLDEKMKEIAEVKGLSKDDPKSVGKMSDEPRKGLEKSRGAIENSEFSKDSRQGEVTKQSTAVHRNELEDNVSELRQDEKRKLQDRNESEDQFPETRQEDQSSENKVSSRNNVPDHGASAKSKDVNYDRSKRASLRMRQNNPDIADLSDPNRPTKIAERFSELYDNEWTEAFEELSKRSRQEQESIDILLAVVTEAYKFCERIAEEQTKTIMKAWNTIFEIGPDDYKNQSSSCSPEIANESKSLIVQYRKKIASLALPKLKNDFPNAKITDIKDQAKLPKSLKAFDLYVDKVVELTWWMCVQDPPIYLCPPRKDGDFEKNLYRAYTKSGTSPQFFVWPALRLHEQGGVLMKGVVQFE